MAEKRLPAPTPKPGKTKIPVANKTTKRVNISLEPRVIIRPIDYNQGQNDLNPPNEPVHLPEQLPNIPNPPPPPPIPAYLPNPQTYQTNKICQINRINRISQTHQINKIHHINKTHPIYQTHQINQIQWISQTPHSHNR